MVACASCFMGSCSKRRDTPPVPDKKQPPPLLQEWRESEVWLVFPPMQWKAWWDALILLAVLYSAGVVPYRICFFSTAQVERKGCWRWSPTTDMTPLVPLQI